MGISPRATTFCWTALLSVSVRMHALVRNAASTESALSRASLNLNSTYGRSPAYRRLASQLSQTRHEGSSLRQGAMPGAIMSPLRSPFLPAELRLPMISTQARGFHISSRRFEAEKVKTAEDKSSEQKAKDDSEPKSEEEAKKSE